MPKRKDNLNELFLPADNNGNQTLHPKKVKKSTIPPQQKHHGTSSAATELQNINANEANEGMQVGLFNGKLFYNYLNIYIYIIA
jgi:hypothetical protein